MANPANETIRYPFNAFNFAVEITVEGDAKLLCNQHSPNATGWN